MRQFEMHPIKFISLHISKSLTLNLHLNKSTMSSAGKNKGLMWVLFFIATAAFLFAWFVHWPWLTLILPFVTTFFVKAMDII